MREEFAYAARELAGRPSSYLKAVLLPDHFASWFPTRLAREVAGLGAHPLSFIRGALATDEIGSRRRRRFVPLLLVSLIAHACVIGYLMYAALLSPYSSFRLVSRSYREYKGPVMLGPLYYPPQVLRGPASADKAMTLEEIREREQKRREKAERDRLAKEKAEKEKARKEKEAELARAAENKAGENKEGEKTEPSSGDKQPGEMKFGEINEAPIKDIVSRTYEKYKAGQIDIPTMDFTVMAGFEIEKDGSLSQVRLMKSSGSKILDNEALAILHAISESHALSPIAHLTSNTIRFDLDSKTARLTITGFAPSAREANSQAGALNLLLYAARLTQQSKSPETAELLSLLKVKSDNNRIDAEMMVPRARASEMMRTRFK